MGSIRSNALALGMTGGSAAVILGLIYLAGAGAPARMLVMNAAALGIGLAGVMVVHAARRVGLRLAEPVVLAIGLSLMATALFGQSVEGVTRWITVGGVTIQPGLMFAPLLVVAFAAHATVMRAAAVVLGALASAIQPDAAVAAMIACGSIVLAAIAPSRAAVATAAIAAACFAVALARPVDLAPVPFVDGVYASALSTDAAAAAGLLLGCILMVAPLAARTRLTHRPSVLAFSAVWVAAIFAALLGNYPTPLLGYGGSAIVGYMLSLAMIAPVRAAPATQRQFGTRTRMVATLTGTGSDSPEKGPPTRWRHAGAVITRACSPLTRATSMPPRRKPPIAKARQRHMVVLKTGGR